MIWGRCIQMCRDSLFSWRPLLSLCYGLLVGFIPVQDDIIVQAVAENLLYEDTVQNSQIARPASDHWTFPLIPCLSYSCSGVVPDLASLPCGCKFALADSRICEHDVVCLQKLSTAMPPCRRSSAAERGKTWKGKAKARKTQVTGTWTVMSSVGAAGFIQSFHMIE